MNGYLAALWVVVLAGLAPGLYFMFTFRPRRTRLVAGLDVAGLSIVIVLLYLRQAAVLALSQPTAPNLEAAVTGITFGAAIDLVLWVRAVRWWKVRRNIREMRRDP